MAIDKNKLQEASQSISSGEIPQLVEWLSQKDDKVRYQAFLLLQSRSAFANDVFLYWDVFQSKLKSDNSYQRSIGLTLLAENAKWDTDGKTETIMDEYLKLLNDEKPITIRQCIQSLGKIVSCKPDLDEKIAAKLLAFDLMAVRETMRKPILLDIINVLLIIRKNTKSSEIENYLLHVLTGEILDKKSKKQIEKLL